MALASYGLNLYEAVVNGISANIVLALRSKRLPSLEHMLKFGFEKALINVLGSFIAAKASPMITGVNEIDIEYLASAIAAAISSVWNRMPATYLAQEQLLISLISHLIATKSSNYAIPYINQNLGNVGVNTVNPGTALY